MAEGSACFVSRYLGLPCLEVPAFTYSGDRSPLLRRYDCESRVLRRAIDQSTSNEDDLVSIQVDRPGSDNASLPDAQMCCT